MKRNLRHARERGIAYFGTCGGFQHMLIEYARHVLGFEDVQHAEYNSYAPNLFVTQLACALWHAVRPTIAVDQ